MSGRIAAGGLRGGDLSGPYTPATIPRVSTALASPDSDAGLAALGFADPQPKVSGGPVFDIGRTYTVTATANAVANGGSATLDYSAALQQLIQQRAHRGVRWRLAYVYGVADTAAGAGPFNLSAFMADGDDLGQAVPMKAQFMPLNAVLPSAWTGALTVLVTNRTGAVSNFHLGLWLAPMGA